jgi:hypothetical protein
VSRNNTLAYLNCSNNRLKTDVLNVLFGMLTDKDITVASVWGDRMPEDDGELMHKKIEFKNNPGSRKCNQRILKAKGWNMPRQDLDE